MVNESARRLGAQRSVIREIFEYGRARAAEIGEDKVFDFSLGNPSVEPPRAVTDGLSRLLTESIPTALHGYTSAAGDPTVRAQIAKYITETYGVSVSASDLYLTVGAAAALSCALGAVVNEGEEVILLAPYFPEYEVFVARAGGSVKVVMCSEPSFTPDAEALISAVTERTAAVIINSPNNPTGAVYNEECLSKIAEALAKKEQEIGHPIYLISDEPYRELYYGSEALPYLPKIYKNTIVCYSFSKSLSIPGERIGYVLVPPTVSESRAVYEAVMGAGRSLGYVCAPSLMQRLLPSCLGECADLSVYDENRRLLTEELTKYGFELAPAEGAFYLFIKAPDGDAARLCRLAREREVLIVPSDSFGYPGWARLSYCVPTERIKAALPALLAVAEEYKRSQR